MAQYVIALIQTNILYIFYLNQCILSRYVGLYHNTFVLVNFVASDDKFGTLARDFYCVSDIL